jgi:hypothetical protein
MHNQELVVAGERDVTDQDPKEKAADRYKRRPKIIAREKVAL